MLAFEQDLFNESIIQKGSLPDPAIHFASDLMNIEDVAALDQTIQDLTTEEDPGKNDKFPKLEIYIKFKIRLYEKCIF